MMFLLLKVWIAILSTFAGVITYEIKITMASIFSKIVKGEIPCHKIAENENFLAFLDAFPIAEGHTLVIPKKEIDYLFDLDDHLYTQLFLFAKSIAPALEKTIPCLRIGLSVIGLEVPHAHVHLIPLNSMADADFGKKIKTTQEELRELAERIRKNT
jgi:histidine triad (HIT) family protein